MFNDSEFKQFRDLSRLARDFQNAALQYGRVVRAPCTHVWTSPPY